MTGPPDDVTIDPQSVIAALRQQLDVALAEKSALVEALTARTGELATRNSEFGERIEHQAATIGVLKAMSASPGDPQPVLDLIARRTQELCNCAIAGLFEVDGDLLQLRSSSGNDATAFAMISAQFPMRLTRGTTSCRAVLEKRIIHIRNVEADPCLSQAIRDSGSKSILSLPLMIDDTAIGAITLNDMEPGGFSDSQIELLKTFAEQAVIAITSAETYRALQTRTSDLQESLEYQTATSDVLKVIGRSAFDLQPVLAMLAETAATLCVADRAAIFSYEDGMVRLAASVGFPPEYQADFDARGLTLLAPDSPGVLPRAARERRVVHVHDAAAVPGYSEAAIKLGNVRTALGVPLLREGEPIGVMVLSRQRVEPFTDRHIELVSTFADQAVIAIENTRLITETREALEQQTATAEVLQVINAFPGNLTPVFDAMLEKAIRLCEAEFGILRTWDEERIHVVAARGDPRLIEWTRRRGAFKPDDDDSPLARIVSGEQVVHTADALAERAYQTSAGFRAMVDASGFRSGVTLALRKDAALLGTVTVYRIGEVRPFTDKQVALLQNFAAQAVIAMENARLLTEQREALERQTAIAEILQVINESPGKLEPVFDAILEKSMRLCDAAFGMFNAYDGTSFRTMVTRGVPAPFAAFRARHPPIPGPGTPFGRAIDTKQPVHVVDWLEEPTYKAGTPGGRAIADLGGARTVLNVSLVKDTVVLGMISFYRQQVRPFSETHIALLESFAAQAVIAMENARLLDEIRQRQEELRITFENMGDGVAMFDETHRLVAWNAKFQEILDLPDTLPEEHRTYEEFLRFLAARGDFGAGVDTAEQVRALVASTGRPYGYERTRPDGRVIEIRRNPVPDGGFVLMYSDITERKRSEGEIRAARDAAEAALRELKAAQANLIQAEKMASLGQLTAGIAHEIKNPLNFVNNFASLSVELLDELKETAASAFATLEVDQRANIEDISATLTTNLEKIVEHGQRADGIVRGMLEHSRGISGERRMVDLNTLVDDALNLAYHGARAQDQSFNVSLERDFATGIAPIELTPQDVTRVLLNLFGNAFYATSKREKSASEPDFQPTLKAITRNLGDTVEIRVWDNGTGIPADIKDKLFQPFFTTKPTGEGTGLGLSITYDIVTKQHGGAISVESEEGAYTEFTVTIPRVAGLALA